MGESICADTREATMVQYRDVRGRTERLCAPLHIEDFGVQSMPDASPTKWHLAHTSWFFETFLLQPFASGYETFHPQFNYLFNSYYNQVGPRLSRPERGLLSRPTVREVFQYRAWVDAQIQRLSEASERLWQQIQPRLVLGLHHEQQHQELLLTDIKHVFACNPLRPRYKITPKGIDAPGSLEPSASIAPLRWHDFPAGLSWIGQSAQGFAFDNEQPRHRVFLEGYQLADRLTTCGEYLSFIEDHGYDRPELWLSDGWAARSRAGWQAPLYWEKRDGQWQHMTLSGMRPVCPAEPVAHVSYYEADAFARWAGCRLPTETEWERSAAEVSIAGNFVENDVLHPVPWTGLSEAGQPAQLFGDVWEWTASPYTAYPGFQRAADALGEYNGKFMCNQFVLRGGSCVSPMNHIRATYRNFFPPETRWQFSGIRLARDLSTT
jgi:ergothioneine biosynthesis protein EgtB